MVANCELSVSGNVCSRGWTWCAEISHVIEKISCSGRILVEMSKKSGRHVYIVLDYEHRQTFFHTDGPDDLNSWLLGRLGNGRLWKHLSPSENFSVDVRSVR